ncbi:EI24 domain-containing protein [Acidimangrovimonas pyrenivorans]|uniref:EI24 domain-containing protein n=1 Tax=Acidimangrovimonas pyrenivorans TaxID=2030798 RepID=A0ABV7AB99_9RHOB
MLTDFSRALAQIGDPRFRRVLWIGLALTLALLAAVYAGFIAVIDIFTPDTITLPWIGAVGGLSTLLSWASLFLMLGLSVFLMVPVASAFTGFFLEDVAQAVEDRYYPSLPPAPAVPLAEALVDNARFFVLLIAVNVVALAVYIFAGPLVPVLFWAINGFLLGREYFQLVAMRRVGRQGAKQLRRRYPLQIWLAGVLMAAPLSLPLVNLVVPILGVATFTHLFHRLSGTRAAPSG